MEYMTFNFSCSYAGLVNLLPFYGVDTEDRAILNTTGYAMTEKELAKNPALRLSS